MRIFFLAALILLPFTGPAEASQSFFKAKENQAYHLSVGAVLFDERGYVACHHFKTVFGIENIYILMRETMENDESVFMTLERGLQEEFGAKATPVAFLGGLKGFLPDDKLPFEKTTLYIACQLIAWDESLRDPNDREAMSAIVWMPPEKLIALMQKQGKRYKNRVDIDESEMVIRALPYIQQASL